MTFADLTTLRVGGPIGRYIPAQTPEELIAALAPSAGTTVLLGAGSNTVAPDAGAAQAVRPAWEDIAIRVDDGGHLLIEVGAGAVWSELADRAVSEGWSGFESLVGIPGSVGAAPVQNIGAYGHEVAELIDEVTVWDRAVGGPRLLGPAELEFGYRTSAIKRSLPAAINGSPPAAGERTPTNRASTNRASTNRASTNRAPANRAPANRAPANRAWAEGAWAESDGDRPRILAPRFVVLSVTFRVGRSRLSAPIGYAELARTLGVPLGSQANAAEVAAAVLALRRSKGMLLDPDDHDTWSTGSYFTNPVVTAAQAAAWPADAPRYPVPSPPPDLVKGSAAWLISQAGIGRGWGLNERARTSTKHVLALTNRGNATVRDIRELGDAIVQAVESAFGVTLQPEPVIW
jgi:UDP-N-acetylmuramate dehydrogenase